MEGKCPFCGAGERTSGRFRDEDYIFYLCEYSRVRLSDSHSLLQQMFCALCHCSYTIPWNSGGWDMPPLHQEFAE